VQLGLDWIARAQAKGWDVLLDAAAFAPTNRLDLTRWRPDFVSIVLRIFRCPTVSAVGRPPGSAREAAPAWFAMERYRGICAGDKFYGRERSAFGDSTPNYLRSGR
jgi:selenocysteine lyase/cysteine desulfurase